MAKMVDINGEKINQIIKDKGLNAAGVSRALGNCESYISQSVSVGRIEEEFFKNLCQIIGVNPRDYIITPPESDRKGQNARNAKEDTNNHLNNEFIISGINAVFRAVTQTNETLLKIYKLLDDIYAVEKNINSSTKESSEKTKAIFTTLKGEISPKI